jgi:DNA-binding NarL/FixJ family response regulator
MPIHLVIADSHPIVLDGMEHLFRQEEDFRLAARCTNGLETMEAIHRHRPDVVILDIRMPEKDGLVISREVMAEKLPSRVVFFTAELDDEQMLEAVHAGVRGIVLKEMKSQLLVQCVRKVHAGENWLDRRSTSVAIEKMLKREAGAYEIAALTTPREIHIIRLTAQGLRNKEIAAKLCISEGTVKVHLHNIYDKLHLDSRLALLRFVQEKGLV